MANRKLQTMCLIGLLAFFSAGIGCGGPTVTVNPNPVEMTFNVTRGGKAVTDLRLNLQTIGEGSEAFGMIENGVAKVTVTPGTYTYYVSAGKSEASLKEIPEAMQSGAMDRKLEITTGATVDIKLD